MQTYTGAHKRAAGPQCRTCKSTEADCARAAGCCSACSHWSHLDANGNDREGKPGRVPTSCEPCRFRRVACVHQPVEAPVGSVDGRLQAPTEDRNVAS